MVAWRWTASGSSWSKRTTGGCTPISPAAHRLRCRSRRQPGRGSSCASSRSIQQTSVRKGPPYGIVRAPRPAPYRKPAGRPRDAVIFSSWVPEDGLELGDYFIETLRRYHADSKIFVGVNHGSSPQWAERLAASGLDVTIQPAAPTLTISCDPTGFVAALDAYRRHEEPFDLVWFGHTKGARATSTN